MSKSKVVHVPGPIRANTTTKIVQLLSSSYDTELSLSSSYDEDDNKEAYVVTEPKLKGDFDQNKVSLHHKVGEGSFGAVYKASLQIGAGVVSVAIKKLTMPHVSFQRAEVERSILAQLKVECPEHIVDYYGYYYSSNAYHIVMEYMSYNNVENYFSKQHNIPVTRADQAAAILQMIDCMAALHKSHVVHRDIKPDNFLLNKTEQNGLIVKLSDFGLSTYHSTRSDDVAKANCERQKMLSQNVGAHLYWAPEVLNHLAYSPASDMFAFGFCMWNVVARSDNYYDGKVHTQKQLREALFDTNVRTSIPFDCPKKVAGWIVRVWEADPFKRLSSQKLKADADLHRAHLFQEKNRIK
jgi:serine/threonine protein kinase